MVAILDTSANCIQFNYDNFNQAPNPSDFALGNGVVNYVNGNMVVTLSPPPAGSSTGLNTLMLTPQSLLYGTVEARVKQAPVAGAITALTLINYNTLDEIDYEWVGDDRLNAWTNFFYRGLRQRNPVTTFEIWSSEPSVSTDTSENFHDYRIDWTPYALTWWIDGEIVHVQNKSETWELANTGDNEPYDHYHYPDTPLQVTFGIWNDNEVPWANGPLNWNDPATANGFTAELASLSVTCYNGPFPSNPNAPPSSTVEAPSTSVVATTVVQSSNAAPTSSVVPPPQTSTEAATTESPTTAHTSESATVSQSVATSSLPPPALSSSHSLPSSSSSFSSSSTVAANSASSASGSSSDVIAVESTKALSSSTSTSSLLLTVVTSSLVSTVTKTLSTAAMSNVASLPSVSGSSTATTASAATTAIGATTTTANVASAAAPVVHRFNERFGVYYVTFVVAVAVMLAL